MMVILDWNISMIILTTSIIIPNAKIKVAFMKSTQIFYIFILIEIPLSESSSHSLPSGPLPIPLHLPPIFTNPSFFLLCFSFFTSPVLLVCPSFHLCLPFFYLLIFTTISSSLPSISLFFITNNIVYNSFSKTELSLKYQVFFFPLSLYLEIHHVFHHC